MQYFIRITKTALDDIENTHDYIAYELLEPITADKYIRGIFDAINHLTIYGVSIAISQRDYLLSLYGETVRTINYKKMSIIYTIDSDMIIVQCVVSSSLIL